MSPRKWNSSALTGALRAGCNRCCDARAQERTDVRAEVRQWRVRKNAALLAAGLALLGGCTRHKAPRPFYPPSIMVRTAPETTPPELPPAPTMTPAELELAVLMIEPSNPSNPQLPPPPPPPKAPPPVPAPSKPEVVETPPPATPQLAQIITPAQRAAYTRELDESLDRIRRAVASLAGRRLNASQQEALDSIRTFQRQAEQAREQDLVTAVSLARRADLLAKDLLQRLP